MSSDSPPPDAAPDTPTGSSTARAVRRARRIGGRSGPSASGGGASAHPAETAVPAPTAAPAERAVPVEAGAPAGAAPTGAEPPGRRWRRWLAAWILGAACVAFAAVGVAASHGVWWDRGSTSVAGQRGPVLSAAKSCMAAMNTYDYRKLDQAEANGLACTTGTFTDQYKKAFDTVVKKNAGKLQATQTAQVNNAGIESVSPDGKQWVVLVFGQLATTNSQTSTTAPTLAPFSARVTMEMAGGKWRVANYQIAPGS
jgi:hypothetical protein